MSDKYGIFSYTIREIVKDDGDTIYFDDGTIWEKHYLSCFETFEEAQKFMNEDKKNKCNYLSYQEYKNRSL